MSNVEKVCDKNFDSLIERFEKKVYGSAKGDLRLELIKKDYEDFLPDVLKNSGQHILDAGAGFGQISHELSKYNHKIILCDVSKKMLKKSADIIGSSSDNSNIEYIHSAFQDLPSSYYNQFDLVISHAVLEWLAEPKKSLQKLLKFIKPGGYLSLMFYNKNSLIYYNSIRGNLKKILKKDFEGYPNSLTPLHPLIPKDVEQWLNDVELKIINKTGIRCFYDYIHWEVQKQRPYEDILKLEKTYNRTEPFASMGRYIHLICKST
ncbi:MAG: methyltransferase domain-containing protein [Melioribacteraceae bacterium]|nr:methyltransferase domain-containing protein [Melioribacteraceae bacterium]